VRVARSSSSFGRLASAFVGVGVLVLGVAACGGAEEASDTPGAGSTPTIEAAPTTEADETSMAEAQTTSTTVLSTEVMLVDFRDPTEAARWVTVNDPVMGGRSTSELASGEEGLGFSGVVSLENNGGFASVRGPEDPNLGVSAARASAFRVRARGDGQTYVLQFRVAGEPWSYIQRFTTEADVTVDHELAVGNFEAVDFFLNPAAAAPVRLDPSTISQISVYILDEQEGPFALTLVGIDALS